MKAIYEAVLILLVVLLSGCMSNPAHFDESNWRRIVETQRIESLYDTHYKDGKFFNPWAVMENRGFKSFLKWRLSKKASYSKEERNFRPDVIDHLKDRIKSKPDTNFIAWIGHGTFFMRIQGEYWLTDPIFSNRAFLPKRITPPAISGKEIVQFTERINVIISHNHYDHLDAKSIRSLPQKARFFVPLGLKSYIQSLHNGSVNELDWWEDIELKNGMKLVCLPAQHWSRRIGQGVNRTLWASFLIISPVTSIYYGGDSGYFKGYREIGRRFQGIEYALLPVTAYHPRWFMHYAHMNAFEAQKAFKDLGATYFIPTQWGTFHLGEEPPGYPIIDLKRVIQQQNLDPSAFIIMNIGEVTYTGQRSMYVKGKS